MDTKPQPILPLRQPHFADNRWYTSQSSQLEVEMKNYLDNPPTLPASHKVVGLVAPHAGHFFSGHVAGASFATLTPNTFETVILIGPDHRGAARGQISTPNVEAWRTPLGDIPVAWELLKSIEADIALKRLAYDEEHSLEIELPFLQVALQHFKLVPLMMGDQSLQSCRQLTQALIKLLKKRPSASTLLVASSDFSHFFDDSSARRLDEETLQFILKLDSQGLIKHINQGQHQKQPLACGYGPIAVVMDTAQTLGATQAHLLKYATSADVQPTAKDRVVGYAAIAFSQD